MTLVIAQKKENQISFSSDSRIAFNDYDYVDFGIKIFSIPVKIISPIPSGKDEPEIIFNHYFGLAVIGSTINTYSIKESINEVLQHLQYIPGATDLSMGSIAKIVYRYYEKTTRELIEILRERGLCQLLLAGLCPLENRIRIYEFNVELKTESVETSYKEILEKDGILFYGSGKTIAKGFHDANKSNSSLSIVKHVIKSPLQTVGGGLQYGEFVDNDFRIFGVVDNDINEDGTFNKYLFTLRGIDIYKGDFERPEDGFHIEYNFKEPFRNEANEALMRGL